MIGSNPRYQVQNFVSQMCCWLFLVVFMLNDTRPAVAVGNPSHEPNTKISRAINYTHIAEGVYHFSSPGITGWQRIKTVQAFQYAAGHNRQTHQSHTAVSTLEAVVFETQVADYTVSPVQTLSLSTRPTASNTYQTDWGYCRDGESDLGLTRYYNPRQDHIATFGNGWHLLIPFEVSAYSDRMIPFLNAIIPDKMVVRNLLTGDEEILSFSDGRYNIAGYVPDDAQLSSIIGLFLLSDGSFRLADKLGAEFQFDGTGRLTDMVFTDSHTIAYRYGYETFFASQIGSSHFRLETVDNGRTDVVNLNFPTRLRFTDSLNHTSEVLIIAANNPHKAIGYLPVNQAGSQVEFLAIMSDGSFQLDRKDGSQIAFNQAGLLVSMTSPVVTSMTCRDTTIMFNYGFGQGQPRIDSACITSSNRRSSTKKILYQYNDTGRLAGVLPTTGDQTQIKYDSRYVMATIH